MNSISNFFKNIFFTKQFQQRLFCNVLGLWLLSFGVAIAINANLGISPVISLPFATSLVLGLTPGFVSAFMLLLYILAQFMLLRKKFTIIHAAQVVPSFIFGFFLDANLFLIEGFILPTYIGQLTTLAIGIFIISLGIVIITDAQLMNMPPEGCVLVLADTFNTTFGKVKVYFDCSHVLISMAITWFFLGRIEGVREGTVMAAIFVGKLIPFHKMWLTKFVYKKQTEHTNEETN